MKIVDNSQVIYKVHKRNRPFCVLCHIFLIMPSLTPVILLI